ncbi:hypothetical protein [Stenomitos frigidus]|uniref:Amidase domain-containing protein n=1 Tax=Stenomitos frigidus ULC18 TaxID=2107698 RepID=A0A2T1DTB9_9CYAN|nr:hypothetical protein [Stenomitos frigidus]PSB23725.1 hypothetical protein C7B82_29780 [Stenomitos frigidus ULC18]
MLDSFIPVAFAVAPNPLGLPSNLKLTTIPIDAYTCFELWMPTANGTLLPEEAMLLRGDRARLEDICAKLTDFMGATLASSTASNHTEPSVQTPTHNWGAIRRKLYEAGADFDAIGVTYLPQVIYPSLDQESGLPAWTLQQSGWSISFLTLHPIATGFRSDALPLTATIAFGQSITKRLQAVPVVTSQTCLHGR